MARKHIVILFQQTILAARNFTPRIASKFAEAVTAPVHTEMQFPFGKAEDALSQTEFVLADTSLTTQLFSDRRS